MNSSPPVRNFSAKTLSGIIGLTLLAIGGAPCLRAEEVSMFNGRDLTGWKGFSEIWSVKDAAITGRLTDQNSKRMHQWGTFLIWQGGEVADFDFSCKYKLLAENPEGLANSGIEFRASVIDQKLYRLNGYQGEIDPGTMHIKKWPEMTNATGCLTTDPAAMLLAPVGQKVIAHPGEIPGNNMLARFDVIGSLGTNETVARSIRQNDWNDYRIVASGTHIQIFVNGLQTVDAIDEGNRYQSGLIGIQMQGLKAPRTIQFKELKLRILQGKAPEVAAASVSPVATIQTDPHQSRIEVLKEQAPNAIEWTLAPLDQTVPANIRQNLTILREDLLDEGKQKPKAANSAYALASEVCNALLAALEERNQTLARAGFRAVEAQARTGVTSEALEARRNHMLSWPQFERENAQRAELKSQATSNAAVMTERPKLQWTERTVVLRKPLEGLYAQFREALRQSAAAK